MIYYGGNDYRDYYIAHHGIAGQKWGRRNGPPYPLDADDHSASEKKAGWRKSLSGAGRVVKKTAKAVAGGVQKVKKAHDDFDEKVRSNRASKVINRGIRSEVKRHRKFLTKTEYASAMANVKRKEEAARQKKAAGIIERGNIKEIKKKKGMLTQEELRKAADRAGELRRLDQLKAEDKARKAQEKADAKQQKLEEKQQRLEEKRQEKAEKQQAKLEETAYGIVRRGDIDEVLKRREELTNNDLGEAIVRAERLQRLRDIDAKANQDSIERGRKNLQGMLDTVKKLTEVYSAIDTAKEAHRKTKDAQKERERKNKQQAEEDRAQEIINSGNEKKIDKYMSKFTAKQAQELMKREQNKRGYLEARDANKDYPEERKEKLEKKAKEKKEAQDKERREAEAAAQAQRQEREAREAASREEKQIKETRESLEKQMKKGNLSDEAKVMNYYHDQTVKQLGEQIKKSGTKDNSDSDVTNTKRWGSFGTDDKVSDWADSHLSKLAKDKTFSSYNVSYDSSSSSSSNKSKGLFKSKESPKATTSTDWNTTDDWVRSFLNDYDTSHSYSPNILDSYSTNKTYDIETQNLYPKKKKNK